jgi:hypothetical protein
VERCVEDGVDRAGPNDEELEEDEYVLLGCQRVAGDGGGEDGASNLGAPLWMPSVTFSRVRPGTPQKTTRPSLFQLFGPPTRLVVLCISMSYCAWK